MEKECESCLELAILNDDGVCALCAAGHDAFRKAAGKVRRAGGTREEAYKAGTAAAAQVDLEAKHVDMSKGVTAEGITNVASFLTVRSIEYNLQYLAEEGRPPWTDEQIAKLYGQAALTAWKKHQEKLAAPQASAVIIPLPNTAMKGFSVAQGIRDAVSGGDEAA